MGCLRPKYFFFGPLNLLLQKIKLTLISFFSGVSAIVRPESITFFLQ
jgi:hypothetical protein